jgi:DNA-binding CsgD family transcriptional regulator
VKQRARSLEKTTVERARELYGTRSWRAAYDALNVADRESPLCAEDLEILGFCAYIVGKQGESSDALTRAHHDYLNRGLAECAARTAFWIGFPLAMSGESALGIGWMQRARRVLDDASCAECVIHGYLQMPAGIRLATQGDLPSALAAFANAIEIGERFKDRDLVILGRQAQGRTLVASGRIDDGIALFDEIMVSVATDHTSPMVIGGVYCSAITACNDVFDFRRAQQWAEVLHAWCASEPDIVPHRGECLVRHAEIVRFHGGWAEAMQFLTEASPWLADPPNQPAAGAAFYEQGELLRLRGEFDAAEENYRKANQRGRRPQPGLALMRLAQGRLDDAVGSIRQTIAETRNRSQRAVALTAAVEILLAADDVAGARRAADDLMSISEQLPVPFLRAASAHALGAVRLAEGDASGAIGSLREALTAWQTLDAPYDAARVHLLMALAHRRLGDNDTASMELDASRDAFASLGATIDLARVAELSVPSTKRDDALTDREVEVLRLVATGKTNRAIATSLGISEKTVARHVSNIFLKLGLSSRAAATAYVYEHGLAEKAIPRSANDDGGKKLRPT